MKFVKTASWLVMLSASMLLASCDQNKDSEYYYFKHPKKLKAIFQECQAKGADYFEHSKECGKTYTVVQKFSELTHAFMQNQQAFGQEILRLQVSVYNSQKALAQAKQDNNQSAVAQLSKNINEDQLTIDKLHAIVGVFVTP